MNVLSPTWSVANWVPLNVSTEIMSTSFAPPVAVTCVVTVPETGQESRGCATGRAHTA